MLNTITIQGRLTATPELKTTPSGASVINFTLAVERDFKNNTTGERDVDFFDCVAWRGTAEFVTSYFTKGRMAVVHGSLQSRKYVDKDGNNRRALEIQAEKVYFSDSINSGGNGNTAEYTQPAPEYEALGDDEDLLF